MSDEQRDFVDKVRATLDARSERLSPSHQGRLRAARRTALAAPRRATAHRLWLPALATAALVVVVVTMAWVSRPVMEQELSLAQTSRAPAAGDFEMLTQDMPLELYQDLEFYYWLEQGEANAG